MHGYSEPGCNFEEWQCFDHRPLWFQSVFGPIRPAGVLINDQLAAEELTIPWSSPDGAEVLEGFDALRSLDFLCISSEQLTARNLEPLSSLRHVHAMRLDMPYLNGEGLEAIFGNGLQVDKLYLVNTQCLSRDDLAALSRQRGLRLLSIGYACWDELRFSGLAESGLREVEIDASPNLSTEAMRDLAKISTLKSLALSGDSVGSSLSVVEHLKASTSLNEISIGSDHVRLSDAVAIGKIASIQRCTINCKSADIEAKVHLRRTRPDLIVRWNVYR